MNSAGTAIGYFFPVTGGIMLLKDITEAKDGERIRAGLQKQFKEEYYEYRHLDLKKSDRARDRYYELGGEECLGCMKEAQLKQGSSN